MNRASGPVQCFCVFAILLVSSMGCGKDKERPKITNVVPEKKEEESPEEKFKALKIPGGDEEQKAGRQTILIKSTGRAQRYRHEPHLPAGNVNGICYMPAGAPKPANRPVNVRSAVKRPEATELDYYKKFPPKEESWTGRRLDSGGRAVAGAVIILRDIKVGPSPLPEAPRFSVWQVKLRPRVALIPKNYRMQFRTYDWFSCYFVLSRLDTGKKIFEAEMPGNRKTKTQGDGFVIDAKTKDELPGGSWYKGQWMGLAVPVQTKPIREAGIYVVTCRRHPWQKAYLVTIDNPYAAVSEARYRRGTFSLKKVPEGKWKVDVWHPVYEPVKKSMHVEIKRDETLQLNIEFKPSGGAR